MRRYYIISKFFQDLGSPINTLKFDPEFGGTDMYSQWFLDLHGGKTEYIITIATMIGKSRMKGEKIITSLIPYGAEKPRSGMMKSAETHAVEILWDPPKGEFTKYELSVDKMSDKKVPVGESFLRVNSQLSKVASATTIQDVTLEDQEGFVRPEIRTIDLSNKLTQYKLLGKILNFFS